MEPQPPCIAFPNPDRASARAVHLLIGQFCPRDGVGRQREVIGEHLSNEVLESSLCWVLVLQVIEDILTSVKLSRCANFCERLMQYQRKLIPIHPNRRLEMRLLQHSEFIGQYRVHTGSLQPLERHLDFLSFPITHHRQRHHIPRLMLKQHW
jgi:hypothetical protein